MKCRYAHTRIVETIPEEFLIHFSIHAGKSVGKELTIECKAHKLTPLATIMKFVRLQFVSYFSHDRHLHSLIYFCRQKPVLSEESVRAFTVPGWCVFPDALLLADCGIDCLKTVGLTFVIGDENIPLN